MEMLHVEELLKIASFHRREGAIPGEYPLPVSRPSDRSGAFI